MHAFIPPSLRGGGVGVVFESMYVRSLELFWN